MPAEHINQHSAPPSEPNLVAELRREVHRFTTGREFADFVVYARTKPKEFPYMFLERVAQMGYLGLDIPEEYGGIGAKPTELSAVLQELSRGDAGLALSVLVPNSLVAYPITTFATEEQKQQTLPPLAAGEEFGCFGLTEANVGSDAKGIRTKAEWDSARKGWMVNGDKNFITSANGARYMILAVRTGTPESREAGISVLLADLKANPGATIGEPLPKMGQAGSTLCQVFFDDFFVPEAALMGNVNEGWPIVARTLEHSRITIAAQGAGIVERSYDEAERFAGERVQHLTPTKSRTIAEIPRVAQRLAMMQRQRDIVSYLVQKAARHEEMDDPDFAVWGSLAKLVSGETAIWAAYASMLTHGGMGYITETEIAHVFNAAPVIGIYEGTADIQSKILEQYFTDDQILSVLPPQTAHLRDPAHFPPAKTVIKDIDMWTTR